MFRYTILLLFLQHVSAAPSSWDAWTDYKIQYGKSYATRQEDNMRRSIWERTRIEILPYNVLSNNNENQFSCNLNMLADLTEEERMVLKGTKPPSTLPELQRTPISESSGGLPVNITYESSRCMPPIKQQGQCGSCWAFAATTLLEYYSCMQNGGQLRLLSEQNLVDCSTNDRNCQGGFYTSAWEYAKSAKGLCKQNEYPYVSGKTALPENCRRATCQVGVGRPTGFIALPENEKTMAQAVATIGPIAVAMDASLNSFDFYAKGIYSDPRCTQNVNHAVVIIGYGSDRKFGDYWIVRNSWSTNWGEKGNFRIKRGVNTCGIGNYPFYPLL